MAAVRNVSGISYRSSESKIGEGLGGAWAGRMRKLFIVIGGLVLHLSTRLVWGKVRNFHAGRGGGVQNVN